jgi:hypothetical protein
VAIDETRPALDKLLVDSGKRLVDAVEWSLATNHGPTPTLGASRRRNNLSPPQVVIVMPHNRHAT